MKRIIAILISVCLCIVCFSACTSAKSDNNAKTETTKTQSLRKSNYIQDVMLYKNYTYGVFYNENPYETDGIVDFGDTYKSIVDNRHIAKAALDPDLNDEIISAVANYLKKDVFNSNENLADAASLRFVQKTKHINSETGKTSYRYFYKVNIKNSANLNKSFSKIGNDVYVYATVYLKDAGVHLSCDIVDYSEKQEGYVQYKQCGLINPKTTYYNIVDSDENGEFLESAGGYLLEFKDAPASVNYEFRCYFGDNYYTTCFYSAGEGPFCFSGYECPSRIDVRAYTDTDANGFSDFVVDINCDYITVFNSEEIDYENAKTISSEEWNHIVNDKAYTEIEWVIE